MSNLTAEAVLDLVNGTLKRMPTKRFRQIVSQHTRYEVLPRWFKKDRITVDDGLTVHQVLMSKASNESKWVGLHAQDKINITNHTDVLDIPWAHMTSNWSWEHREVLMNRGKSLMLKVLQPRRYNCLLGIADRLEESAFWTPDPNDDSRPRGVPYWVTIGASTGFTGMNPDGFSDCGGINAVTTAGWRNWSDTYTDRTKADFVRKLRKMGRNINFKSPVTVKDLEGDTGMDYRLYTNEDVYSDMEELAENQNENIGRDLAGFNGTFSFKKNPIVLFRTLDARTDDPVYMINHGTFKPVVLKGDYLRESPAMQVEGRHNSYVIFHDLTCQYICEDRRSNGVLSEEAA